MASPSHPATVRTKRATAATAAHERRTFESGDGRKIKEDLPADIDREYAEIQKQLRLPHNGGMERSLVENALKYYESRGQPGNYTDVLADQLIRCNIMEEVWRARTITLQIEIRQYDMQLGREVFGRVLSGHVHTGAEVAAPTAGIDNSTIAGPVGPLSPGSVDRRAIGSVNAPAPGPALLPDFTDLPTPTTQAPTSNMTADSMAASLTSTSEVGRSAFPTQPLGPLPRGTPELGPSLLRRKRPASTSAAAENAGEWQAKVSTTAATSNKRPRPASKTPVGASPQRDTTSMPFGDIPQSSPPIPSTHLSPAAPNDRTGDTTEEEDWSKQQPRKATRPMVPKSQEEVNTRSSSQLARITRSKARAQGSTSERGPGGASSNGPPAVATASAQPSAGGSGSRHQPRKGHGGGQGARGGRNARNGRGSHQQGAPTGEPTNQEPQSARDAGHQTELGQEARGQSGKSGALGRAPGGRGGRVGAQAAGGRAASGAVLPVLLGGTKRDTKRVDSLSVTASP